MMLDQRSPRPPRANTPAQGFAFAGLVCTARPRAARGFTLIELMAVMIGMTVIMGASVAVFSHSVKVNTLLESNDNMKNYGQFAVNAAKLPLQQSRTIYQNDTYGNALWGLMTWSGHTPIGTTALPTISETGSLSPSELGDPTTPFDSTTVGNALLFTESTGHQLAGTRWIDTFRLRAYYVTKNFTGKMQGKDYCLDVMDWVGPTYVDYTELVGAPNAVFSALVANGFTRAWNSQATSKDSTVYTLNASGVLSPLASPALNPVNNHSATKIAGNGGDTRYSVAFNDRASYPIQDRVPAFGTAHSSGDGFPNGFETMIVGPTGGRKVMLRLVLVGEGYSGRHSMAHTVIASARNY